MSEFSSILGRIEPDPPPHQVPRDVAIRANATHSLDEIPSSDLATFLRDYLLDRVQQGDVEDASDEAGDVDLFVVGPREVTISAALPNYGIAAPQPRVRLGSHSDGSPCFDDDRICY